MTRSAARIVGLVSVLGIGVASLTGCANLIPTGNERTSSAGGAVGFEDVQTATIQIEAQGTFTPPGEGEALETAGRGSGFFISKDGLAITNNHVVVGAGVLEVWVGGDTSETLNAKVLGASECLDLALIDVDGGDDLPFLAFEDAAPKTAQEVYAAGFPLGDPEFTMTKGIVSKTEADGESDWASLDFTIEHDARIRGGNSGGPLITADGTVLGVNYAGDDVNDLNFAIPTSVVEEVLEDLKKGNNPESLGINAQALPPAEEGALGIWVNSVASGSPADALGIEPGDVLTKMEGVTLAAEGTLAEYCDVLRTKGTDAVITAEVYRPSTGTFYSGQFNGTALEEITVPGASGEGEPTTSTESFTTVTSDSGAVEVDVPSRWSQVDGSSFESEAGIVWDGVAASSDLEGYFGGWETGGVDVSASRDAIGTYTAESLLAEFTSGSEDACTLDESGDYSDAVYAGVYAYYVGCGDAGSDFVVVAAADEGDSHMIVMRAVLADDDDRAALRTILDTFLASL